MITGVRFSFTIVTFALPAEVPQMKKGFSKITKFLVLGAVRTLSRTGSHSATPVIISKAPLAVVAKKTVASAVGPIQNTIDL